MKTKVTKGRADELKTRNKTITTTTNRSTSPAGKGTKGLGNKTLPQHLPQTTDYRLQTTDYSCNCNNCNEGKNSKRQLHSVVSLAIL